MKKILLAFAALFMFLSFYSCRVRTNECPYNLDASTVAPDSEVTRLTNYITTNSITATKHPSGIYYTVTTDGAGATAGQCSTVGVTYFGKLTNGSIFDGSNSNVFFPLNTLIYGWRVGIPLVKKGGTIRLYIPPAFGYGQTDVKNSAGVVTIPKNSILVFDVSVNEIN
ncbi:MAG: FKBP-type peptidyl-prolyl cis-trans isomerase [Sphingobacteriales bacterium]|nr:FKBP-type peptidyl-prolyl cis-trans isomerase [Sphingobacteriales bacterium]